MSWCLYDYVPPLETNPYISIWQQLRRPLDKPARLKFSVCQSQPKQLQILRWQCWLKTLPILPVVAKGKVHPEEEEP